MKNIYKIFYKYSFFCLIYYHLRQRFQELIMQELDKLYKNPHYYSLWLIMNYQSSNFGGEGSWNENVKKGVKVYRSFPFKI